MKSLFISFGKEDLAKAVEVRGRLRGWGYEALFLHLGASDGIPAGLSWEREIYRQLRRARGVVFLASKTSVESQWCFAELSLARSQGKPVFPVRVADGAWLDLLADTQWADLADGEAGFDMLRDGLRHVLPDPDTDFQRDRTRPPYPGLEAFAPQDAGVFFGRDKEIAQLLDLLHPASRPGHGRFVAIAGPSGSGKSSLLRAGLVPRLSRMRERWLVLPALVPGAQPLRSLAHSVAQAFDELGRSVPVDEIAGRLPGGLAELGEELRALSRCRHVLVVIDQAEELMTRCDADEQQDFLACLRDGIGEDSPVWAVATVRLEFLSGAPDRPGLASVIDDTVLVEPVSRAQLPVVVERPAEEAGMTFAAGLVGRMVEDSTGGDALPLLACTLQQLFQVVGAGGEVTDIHYDTIGGVVGSLHRQADRVTAELTDRGYGDLVLPTILRLADVPVTGDPTGRRVSTDTLSAAEDAVVRAFVEARLLVRQDSFVAVAHEALLRQWTPLRDAIAADRAANRTRHELEDAAVMWVPRKGDHSALYRGNRLAAARAWAAGHRDELSSVAAEFLTASTRRHRRAKRIRHAVAVAVAVLTVGVFGLLGYAFQSGADADAARASAAFNRVTVEADQLRDVDASLAAQLDLVAYRMQPTPQLANKLIATANVPLGTAYPVSTEYVRSVALSPDGRTLATGTQEHEIRLWRVTGPSGLRPLGGPLPVDAGAATSLAFSPNGRVLVSAGNGAAQLWDLRDTAHPERLGRLAGHISAVSGVVFSPDGRTVATAGEDRSIRLWDVTDPKRPAPLARPLTDHTEGVLAVAFSPDGRTLASVGNDETLRLWNVADRADPSLLATLVDGHTGPTLSVAFSPDSRTIATGSQDRTVRLWDVTDPARPERLGQLTGHTSFVWSVAFSPDGGMLATAGYDHRVWLWDVTDPRTPAVIGRALTGHTGPISTVVFGRRGTLVTGSHDGTVRLWQVPGTIATGHTAPVTAAAFTRDGRILATGSQDASARLWRYTGPGRLTPLGRTPAGATDVVDTVAFSPDGKVLATAGKDHLVRLWNTADPAHPALLAELAGHEARIWTARFSPDGSTLASGDDDGVVRLWNVTDPSHPTEVAVLRRHTGFVAAVAFSPDGRLLATGSGDRTVQLWDLGDLPPTPLGTADDHTGPVWSVAFSPDGHTVASSSEDSTVRLWDATDPRHLRALGAPLVSHTDTVFSVAFAPGGRTLVSAGQDAKVVLWDVADPARPMALGATVANHAKAVYVAVFAPDGRAVVTGSEDHTVQAVATDVDDAISRVCATTGAMLTRERWQKYLPDTDFNPPC